MQAYKNDIGSVAERQFKSTWKSCSIAGQYGVVIFSSIRSIFSVLDSTMTIDHSLPITPSPLD